MSGEIEVDDLTVRYGGISALVDVTFRVEPSEWIAVVGPNGAGKSTLLNAVNGVAIPSSGRVRMAGHDIANWPAHRVARLRVHRSFQDPRLVDTDSVINNVMGGLTFDGVTRRLTDFARPRRMMRREAALRASCLELLVRAKLDAHALAPAGGLSFGNRKLVDILRAMVGGPTILLLDEPSSGMGEQDRDRLTELLLDFRQRSAATVVLVEHHMDIVRAVADDVMALAQGRLVFKAPVDTVDDLESLGVTEATESASAAALLPSALPAGER